MARLGIFRNSTAGSPQTARSFSAPVTRRQTTTATTPITGSASSNVVNITGQSTVRGLARQGTTPKVTGLRNRPNPSGSAGASTKSTTTGYRSVRGLFR